MQKFDRFGNSRYPVFAACYFIVPHIHLSRKRFAMMHLVHYKSARGNQFVLSFMAFTLVLLASQTVNAQQIDASKSADTTSPRATLKSFIDACNEMYGLIKSEHYLDAGNPGHARMIARIIDCVDVSGIPAFARDQRAEEIAICIKEILDREEFPDWESIPDESAIEAVGDSRKTQSWRFPGSRITIVRVEDGPKKHEFLFSQGTAGRAVSDYRNISSDSYRTSGPAVSKHFYDWYVSVPGKRSVGIVVQQLPEWLQRNRTFGMANWKWAGILLTLLFSSVLMLLAYRLQWELAPRYKGTRVAAYCMTLAFPVVAMLIPPLAQNFLADYLTIRGNPLYVLGFVANCLAILAGIAVIFSAANRVAELIIATPRINPLGLNAQLIRICAKLVSLVATVLLFIFGGHFLGIPVGTLFASAGIFGAALALAAQDTLKNLLGTIVLFGDKPFRVGERIKVASFDGFVEDIGLRSTRIRLLNGHVVTVPNSHLAATDIENISSRPNIRSIGEVSIPLDTPVAKIEEAVAIIRDALADHEGMDPNRPPRVHFAEISPVAFKIQYFFWYTPDDYWKFQDFAEKINFLIFHKFETAGIQFSLPFRHTFWKFDDEQGPVDVRILSDGDVPMNE